MLMDADTWEALDELSEALGQPEAYFEQCEVCGIEFVSEGETVCPDCVADRGC